MTLLARRIRDCRYAKGWGPEELASRAEISRTALYQIERGKTGSPRAGTLRRIARALDVSIERLLAAEPGEDDLAAGIHPGAGRELDRKFHELLASPLGEGVARIVEASHGLLPSRGGV